MANFSAIENLRAARRGFTSDASLLGMAEGSYDEANLSAVISQREHSADYTNVSKFSEAMKNPDWRRRPDSRAVSSSTETSSGHTNNKNSSCQSHKLPEVQRLSASPHLPRAPYPWDHIDDSNHWKSSDGCSELEAADTRASTEGFCTLINKAELANFQRHGRPISVVELSPFLNLGLTPQSFAQSDHVPGSGVVYIQAFNQKDRKMIETRAQIHEPRCESIHNTEIVEATSLKPTQLALKSNFPQNIEESRETQSSLQEKARKAVLGDPTVADIGASYQDCRSNRKRPEIQVQSPPKNKAIREKNAAFEKLLQKLKKPELVKQTGGFTSPAHVGHGEEHECPWGFRNDTCREHNNPQGSTFEKDFGSRKSTNQASSLANDIDSSYTRSVRGQDSSLDSGISLNNDPLCKARLNPRAREFLSFEEKSMAQSVEDHIDHFSGKPAYDKPWKAKGSGNIAAVSSLTTKPLSAITPDLGGIDGSGREKACEVPLNNTVMMSGSAAFNPTLDSPVSWPVPASYPAFVGHHHPPGLVPPPQMFSGIPPAFPMGPGAGISPAYLNMMSHRNFSTVPAMPTLPAVNPVASYMGQMPACYGTVPPPPTVSGPYSRPNPVVKPTVPDPAQQQAYEAWVEWRKANEPGYALECRSRQQRRARRNMEQPIPLSRGPPQGMATN